MNVIEAVRGIFPGVSDDKADALLPAGSIDHCLEQLRWMAAQTGGRLRGGNGASRTGVRAYDYASCPGILPGRRTVERHCASRQRVQVWSSIGLRNFERGYH